jgi:hypothetical protein
MSEPKLAGSLNKYDFGQADNVWSIWGVSPTILAYNQGQIGHQINILVEENEQSNKEIEKKVIQRESTDRV